MDIKIGDIYQGRKAVWVPQPRQAVFMARGEDEVLFGGAAGGGKSDVLVAEALRQVHIPHYKGLILRKTFSQLGELIDKTLNLYPQIFPKAKYNSTTHTWRFPSGAKIIFGSLPHSKDKYNYQGQAYDFIGFDELTQFTYEEYVYLFSRNRPNGPDTRVYMRATANPGGIGHGWVKDRFITAAPPMTTVWEEVKAKLPNVEERTLKRSRIFVPSLLTDNEALLRNDPGYMARLASLPEAQRKALLYGDWDSFSGQVFTEWRNDPDHYADHRWTHVIDEFEPPAWWSYYRSLDWGYRKPFSIGWWAVDNDGVAYRILEWYGCERDNPDTGLQMEPSEVFRQVAALERTHPYLKGRRIHGVADPAIWQTQTGVSVAEEATKQGVYFTQGDNSRLAGWMQLHERLRFSEDGTAGMYVFKTCRDFIRTFPALVYDERHVEDVATDTEDHQGDEARYFAMARPITAKAPHARPAAIYNPLR